ncbi:hypothetical protein FDW96_03750 [Citrobacter sp. TBCS-15]|uniref:Uncharacterized protein n=1 Tax=Citrobacter werkmanii TaxID=67827 RepID=A0AA38DSX6_9ENTR|nr:MULTISPECIES: hypothetical protein [Citrobacter]MDT0639543.1 hypothetical protein [Citrobacter werkmanii]MEC3945839.1 hypothetical protein [Citrobacter werkmanii]TKU08888.1 hypothetical protein FDW96_03750 [Citrobacter sp. TBCS-15]HAT7592365.1 hypothetical protein [Citrobacter werkmanii]HCL5535751.1 hypothetical protein [Citrobacter werkmanii]
MSEEMSEEPAESVAAKRQTATRWRDKKEDVALAVNFIYQGIVSRQSGNSHCGAAIKMKQA